MSWSTGPAPGIRNRAISRANWYGSTTDVKKIIGTIRYSSTRSENCEVSLSTDRSASGHGSGRGMPSTKPYMPKITTSVIRCGQIRNQANSAANVATHVSHAGMPSVEAQTLMPRYTASRAMARIPLMPPATDLRPQRSS